MKRSLTSSHHLQMLVLFRDNRTDRSRKLIKLLILHNNLKILAISQRWLEVLPITRRGLNKSWTDWALIREVLPNQIMSNLPPLILKTQTQCLAKQWHSCPVFHSKLSPTIQKKSRNKFLLLNNHLNQCSNNLKRKRKLQDLHLLKLSYNNRLLLM